MDWILINVALDDFFNGLVDMQRALVIPSDFVE
jgi:hypothetical protein